MRWQRIGDSYSSFNFTIDNIFHLESQFDVAESKKVLSLISFRFFLFHSSGRVNTLSL